VHRRKSLTAVPLSAGKERGKWLTKRISQNLISLSHSFSLTIDVYVVGLNRRMQDALSGW
jgi:hypothetical protein